MMIRLLLAKLIDRFAPRLLVLLVDLTVTVFAFCCAWTLRFNFALDFSTWHWPHLAGLLACRWLLFLIIRPFAGVIRHTGIEDAMLVIMAVTYSSLLAVTGSLALKYLFDDPSIYIPASILAIEYFISVVLLVGIRFAIRQTYQLLVSSSARNPQAVLLYGAGAMGIYTKEVLLRDRKRNYRIVGFIDDNPAKVQKTVQGIRVYSPHECAHTFFQSAHKPEVILAIEGLTTARRNEIARFLLQYQVTLKLVPSAGDWIKGKLSPHQIRDIRIEDLLGRPAIRLDDAAIGRSVQGRVVLVTGAAGSIGSGLVRQLLAYGPRQIILLDQAESVLYELIFELNQTCTTSLLDTTLTAQIGDVTNANRMYRLFETHRPHLVFHAAAYKHVPLMEEHPYEAVNTNVIGTKVVADLAVLFGANTFVMISTDKAVNPTNVMGATKRLAELYVQSLSGTTTRFIVTRFGNVLSSNGSVVPLFKRQIEAGGPVTVTHPDIFRYFMTIPEACQLVLEAAAIGKGGEAFVFDMGKPVRIADLARQMIRLSGYEVDRDIALQFTGLRPGEKLYEELLNERESVLPTHHPKIKIARLQTLSSTLLHPAIYRLEQLLAIGDDAGLVRILKELIPEYISNNSPYSTLDQKNGVKNVSPMHTAELISPRTRVQAMIHQ
ncbi:polysaccharide biosynthesis protein [Spirosoma rigui]|uniref:polysaccharide biosynthesis protein n=1 Tax=Spirosoma rigui TaxID=564064 RepID=UPI001FE4D8E1|nr:nucleoside-diphosphate sugar epimerase/dehydratase [Spirosoma rigui]